MRLFGYIETVTACYFATVTVWLYCDSDANVTLRLYCDCDANVTVWLYCDFDCYATYFATSTVWPYYVSAICLRQIVSTARAPVISYERKYGCKPRSTIIVAN